MRLLPAEHGTPAALHGLSAFTTVRTRHGLPLLLPAHLARLTSTCRVLGLPDPNGDVPPLPSLPWGLLRLTVTVDGTWYSHRPLPAAVWPPDGADAWLGTQQVHPQLGRHKTGNSLPYLLAGQEARQQGADEGLLLGAAGQVVDGSRSGLLLYTDDAYIIPDGGLPSVTRAAWLAELGRPAETVTLSPDVLRQARHLWLCGAGVGVVPVGRVRAAGWAQDYVAHWPATTDPALVPPD